MATDSELVGQTQHWIKSVVIECNFCPFAKREIEKENVRYSVIRNKSLEDCLQSVIQECVFLDENESTETTLLIFPDVFEKFNDYLQFVEISEKLIADQGYEGVYQLASFHPDYVFADSSADDAANYTNRSPSPMLHFLREASLEKALESYPKPEKIPERNIEVARSLGLDTMKKKLDACRQHENKE